MDSRRSSALARETSGSAIAIDSLHQRACPPITHPNADVLPRLERADRRADVAVCPLDDRVAASEYRERRKRCETALRGHRALPPERYRARDRAIENSSRVVDALAPHREAHRGSPAIDHPPGRLEAPASLLDPLANSARNAAPGAVRALLRSAGVWHDELGRGGGRRRPHVGREVGERDVGLVTHAGADRSREA